MEAVGAVASIVGIATFGFELAKTLKTYVDTVVDADDILRDLTFEIETTAKIIEQLNNFVKEDNADSTRTRTRVLSEQGQKDLLRLTSKCSAVYKKLASELDAPQEGAAPSYSRKLKLPFEEATIKRYREDLGFLKLDLLLHINILIWGQERIMHPDKSDVLLEQVTNLFLQLKKDFINDIISRRNRIERRQSQTNQPVATIDHNGPNEGHHQVAGPHLNYLSRPTTASDHSMRDKRQAPLNHETASQSFVILNNSTLQPNDDSPEEIQEPNTGSPNVPPMMSALSPQIVQPPNDTFQASPHLKPPNLKDIPSSILPRLSSSRLRRPCLSLWQRSFIRDGQSEELEAYYLESAPSTPRRLPLGHKQLTRVLKHIAKTGKDDLGVQYLSLNPGQREAVDMIIQEANRSGSRLKTCIAISVDLMGLFLVVFLSLGEPIDPVYLKFADRVFCFSFELCRTWQGMEKLIHSALGDDPMIGRRVHEGYYDLLTFDSHTILPEVWESVVTPGWNLLLLIRDPPLVDSGPDKLHDQPEWSPKPISPGSIYPPGHQRAGPLSRPPTLGLTGSRAMRMGNDSSSSSSSSPGPPDLPGRAGSDGLDGSAGPTGPPGRDSRDGSPDWLHRSAALGQPLCASFKYHDSMILGSAINYPDTGEDKEESDSINFEAEKQKTDQLQVDDLLRRWTHAADNPHEDDDDDVSTTHATSSNDSNKQN